MRNSNSTENSGLADIENNLLEGGIQRQNRMNLKNLGILCGVSTIIAAEVSSVLLAQINTAGETTNANVFVSYVAPAISIVSAGVILCSVGLSSNEASENQRA